MGSALSPHNSRPSNSTVYSHCGVLALADCDGVWEDVTAAQRLDHTDAPAGITRQAGMRARMNVLCAHTIAGLKSRRRLRLPGKRAARDRTGNFIRGAACA